VTPTAAWHPILEVRLVRIPGSTPAWAPAWNTGRSNSTRLSRFLPSWRTGRSTMTPLGRRATQSCRSGRTRVELERPVFQPPDGWVPRSARHAWRLSIPLSSPDP